MGLIRLSASSIARFKACPTRFQFSDVEGLRLEEDGDALRIGTNWHSLQEIYRKALSNDGVETDAAFESAIAHLNEAYKEIPSSKSAEDWAVERESLVALFIGHLWYWNDDPVETLATEIAFRLPLHHPKTGMPLDTEQVIRLGKIDRIILRGQKIMPNEYKTTGSDLSPTSFYWNRLKMDTQVSMYDLALHDGIEGDTFGVKLPDLPMGGCLYDVTRKPTIKPKKLTQGDSKKFITNGEYCGETFDVHTISPKVDPPDEVKVDNWDAEITPGKKEGSFAIRETPGMYRARLVQDIQERPEHYYARKEIPRTQKERVQFRQELYNIYRLMKYAVENKAFYRNEDHCDQYGGCDYCPICFHDVDVLHGHTPAGMKRIFTPVTVQES